MKNLNGDSNLTPTSNIDDEFIDFEQIISKSIQNAYDRFWYEYMIMPRKNIKLMPADFDSMPAISNFGYEYYDDARTSGFLKVLSEEPETFIDGWTPTSVEIANSEPKEDSISSLKKQIKNCKNPMQLKELNQKLNAAYKKRKKKN